MADEPFTTAATRRAAHMVVTAFIVNAVAFLMAAFVWPAAVLPVMVGWCLSWLTAVVWLHFQEVRRAD